MASRKVGVQHSLTFTDTSINQRLNLNPGLKLLLALSGVRIQFAPSSHSLYPQRVRLLILEFSGFLGGEGARRGRQAVTSSPL